MSFIVFVQAFLHSVFNNSLGIIPENVDSDGDSDQGQQNQGQHSSIGVHHAGIFSAGTAASEESDNKHNCPNDDQDDGGVEVGFAEEVQVLGHVDLDVSTNADQSHTRQEKDEVEQKDNVLDENVTTIHLDRL